MGIRSSAVLVAALVVCSALIETACDDSQLDDVRVCGDLVVPTDILAVRVVVLDSDLEEVVAGVKELAPDGATTVEEAKRQLPVTVAVQHVGGSRVVRVQGLGPSGVEVARADVHVGDAPLEEAIVVNLMRSCLGQLCALGQTCVEGSCVVTPAASAGACVTGAVP